MSNLQSKRNPFELLPFSLTCIAFAEKPLLNKEIIQCKCTNHHQHIPINLTFLPTCVLNERSFRSSYRASDINHSYVVLCVASTLHLMSSILCTFCTPTPPNRKTCSKSEALLLVAIPLPLSISLIGSLLLLHDHRVSRLKDGPHRFPGQTELGDGRKRCSVITVQSSTLPLSSTLFLLHRHPPSTLHLAQCHRERAKREGKSEVWGGRAMRWWWQGR